MSDGVPNAHANTPRAAGFPYMVGHLQHRPMREGGRNGRLCLLRNRLSRCEILIEYRRYSRVEKAGARRKVTRSEPGIPVGHEAGRTCQGGV